jgi:putative addiction module component (TIGR02574 family)
MEAAGNAPVAFFVLPCAASDEPLSCDLEGAMPPTLESVEAEALQLTPDERIMLVGRLTASLAGDPSFEIHPDWAAELDRRQDDIDAGRNVLLPGPETLDQLKAEFS